ncbi:MAG: hypothetical protein CMJ19_19760 [Phycisphaeraceae bacterium]|nr:hypothetical protein [Phycisphaeraceae bacterium]
MTTTHTHTIQPAHYRQAIFDAHTRIRHDIWDANGQYLSNDGMSTGGYRGAMMHVLAYLHSKDEQAIELANRILLTNYTNSPCHFAPSLIMEILLEHEALLKPDIKDLLVAYLKRNLSYMVSDDLQCHGYNDNHPHKAEHALILGGEFLNQPSYIDVGLKRLDQAITVFKRNDFPSEYNSPNYLPVSLKPLAELVNHTSNSQARDMAMQLEQVHWHDLAEHFDGRVGLPTGPFSRGYASDYRGTISNTVMLIAAMFPDKFDFDVIDEMYVKQYDSTRIDPADKARLPFYQSHLVWYITPTYHLPQATAKRIFEDKSGQTVIGQIESGVVSRACPLEGAPQQHVMGPRSGSITTHYGKHYSLGTAQYSWLDGKQAHGMIATIHQQNKTTPDAAANYYTRLFYNEEAPLLPEELPTHCFNDMGEYRTVQHRHAAMVLYNPHPFTTSVQRIRTGIFRPLWHHKPKAIFHGNQNLDGHDLISDTLLPITIDEGPCYVGITPLRLTDLGQSRHADIQICMQDQELAILISTFEGWGPQTFTYNQILHAHTGFVIEVHDATDWPDFKTFRQSLGNAIVEDYELALMRRTRYEHHGIELSASYTPAHSLFRFATGQDV